MCTPGAIFTEIQNKKRTARHCLNTFGNTQKNKWLELIAPLHRLLRGFQRPMGSFHGKFILTKDQEAVTDLMIEPSSFQPRFAQWNLSWKSV